MNLEEAVLQVLSPSGIWKRTADLFEEVKEADSSFEDLEPMDLFKCVFALEGRGVVERREASVPAEELKRGKPREFEYSRVNLA